MRKKHPFLLQHLFGSPNNLEQQEGDACIEIMVRAFGGNTHFFTEYSMSHKIKIFHTLSSLVLFGEPQTQ